MNRFTSLLLVAFCASLAASCVDRDVQPRPQPSLKQTYTASTFSTGGIHMFTKEGMVKDTTFIRSYLNRLVAEEKGPGFWKKDAVLPLGEQQQITFHEEQAQLLQQGEEKRYTYQLANYNYNLILWLTYSDTVVYYANQQPQVLDELPLFKPRYYKEVLAEEAAGFDYKVSTVPEQYASIGDEILYFPQYVYHLKAKSGWEGAGTRENFLNEYAFQKLATGDTLLIQASVLNFK